MVYRTQRAAGFPLYSDLFSFEVMTQMNIFLKKLDLIFFFFHSFGRATFCFFFFFFFIILYSLLRSEEEHMGHQSGFKQVQFYEVI